MYMTNVSVLPPNHRAQPPLTDSWQRGTRGCLLSSDPGPALTCSIHTLASPVLILRCITHSIYSLKVIMDGCLIDSRPSFMIIASVSQFPIYLPWGQHLLSIVSQYCLKCDESGSRCFQPGEGPSRGLFRDYEPSFEALLGCRGGGHPPPSPHSSAKIIWFLQIKHWEIRYQWLFILDLKKLQVLW